jgi:hypothetical protein
MSYQALKHYFKPEKVKSLPYTIDNQILMSWHRGHTCNIYMLDEFCVL